MTPTQDRKEWLASLKVWDGVGFSGPYGPEILVIAKITKASIVCGAQPEQRFFSRKTGRIMQPSLLSSEYSLRPIDDGFLLSVECRELAQAFGILGLTIEPDGLSTEQCREGRRIIGELAQFLEGAKEQKP